MQLDPMILKIFSNISNSMILEEYGQLFSLGFLVQLLVC